MGTNFYLMSRNKKLMREYFAVETEYTIKDIEYEIVDEPYLGISKDTYYYWYKKVQTVCVEAMEMPDTLSMPEFMSLPVPAEPANVPVESAIRSYAVVTMHIGKAGIEAEWDKLLD